MAVSLEKLPRACGTTSFFDAARLDPYGSDQDLSEEEALLSTAQEHSWSIGLPHIPKDIYTFLQCIPGDEAREIKLRAHSMLSMARTLQQKSINVYVSAKPKKVLGWKNGDSFLSVPEMAVQIYQRNPFQSPPQLRRELRYTINRLVASSHSKSITEKRKADERERLKASLQVGGIFASIFGTVGYVVGMVISSWLSRWSPLGRFLGYTGAICGLALGLQNYLLSLNYNQDPLDPGPELPRKLVFKNGK